jgi:hypothetical protein
VREVELGNVADVQWRQKTPGGVTAKVAALDIDSDGYEDWFFIGTTGGQVYRFKASTVAQLQDTNNKAQTLWEPRELLAMNGDGSFPDADCAGPGACDLDNNSDYAVRLVLPYFGFDGSVNVVTYSGNPEGTDAENGVNLPAGSTHRGPIVRVLKNSIGTSNFYNNQLVVANPASTSDPLHVFGENRLPRQLYRSSTRADRLLAIDNMFVLGGKLFSLLYRPSSDVCSTGGFSYFTCIQLEDDPTTLPDESGNDCLAFKGQTVDGLQDPSSDDSTENYAVIGEGIATFLPLISTGEVIIGSAGGAAPAGGVQLDSGINIDIEETIAGIDTGPMVQSFIML